MTTHLPIKNITFNKAGATLTCPYCGKQATYQIGQLDTEEWKKDMYTRGKYVCKDCYWKPVHRATTPPPVGHFPSLEPKEKPKEEKSTLDELLDMT
jgi:hypothetical protein